MSADPVLVVVAIAVHPFVTEVDLPLLWSFLAA
jgi:hypothetical protein